MDMIIGNVNFQIVFFLIFSDMVLVHIGISMRQFFQFVPTIYVFSVNKFFTISFF